MRKVVSFLIMRTPPVVGTTLILWELLCAVACGGATDGSGRSEGKGGRSAGGAGGAIAGTTSLGGTLAGGTAGTNSGQTIVSGWLDASTAGSSSCSAEELTSLELELRRALDNGVARCISSEFWVTGIGGSQWASRTAWQPPVAGIVTMVAACDVDTGDLVDPFAAELTAALATVKTPSCATANVFTMHGLAENEFAMLYQAAAQCGSGVVQVRILLDDAGQVSEIRAVATTPNDPGPTAAADCLRALIADAHFPCLAGRNLCLLRVIDGG